MENVMDGTCSAYANMRILFKIVIVKAKGLYNVGDINIDGKVR
jgi:hypothetical protein